MMAKKLCFDQTARFFRENVTFPFISDNLSFAAFNGQGDRPHLKNIVVLFTDGGSNSFDATIAEARRTREAGIHIIVVAVGGWLNKIEVEEIATDPDSQSVFYVRNFDELQRFSNSLKILLCDGEFAFTVSKEKSHIPSNEQSGRPLHVFAV